MEHIDTILLTVVKTLFSGGNLTVGHLTSAQLAAQVSGSPAVATTQVILTEVAFVLSIVFAVAIVYIAIQRRALVATTAAVAMGHADAVNDGAIAPVAIPGSLRGRWNEVISHLDSAHENDWKAAIVEADKLVDSALQQAGFPGESFGDRLSNIQAGTLISLDGLWWAHRIRNRIAHEMDYFLRYTEARQAASYYEAALAELKLL